MRPAHATAAPRPTRRAVDRSGVPGGGGTSGGRCDAPTAAGGWTGGGWMAGDRIASEATNAATAVIIKPAPANHHQGNRGAPATAVEYSRATSALDVGEAAGAGAGPGVIASA